MNTFVKIASASAVASVFVMASAFAQTVSDVKAPTPYSAYVQDSSGNVVHSQYGDCVHTGYWTDADKTLVGCDGVEAKADQPAAKPAPAPVAKPTPTSEKVTFAADAFFDFDKSVLKPEGRAKLTELVHKLKDVNLEAIVAVGHTDSIGTAAYNKKLSLRRAEAVKAFLVSHGVAADRIYVSGKGETQPVASNKTAEGRAKNRRVEIEVVGTRGAEGEMKHHHKAHHEKKEGHHAMEENKHHEKKTEHHMKAKKHHAKKHHAKKVEAKEAAPAAE